MHPRGAKRVRPAVVLAFALVLMSCTGSGEDAPSGSGAGGEGDPVDLESLTPDAELLPEPAPAAPASMLASRVLEGGPHGEAALLAALRASGISVVDGMTGETVLEPDAPAHGLVIDAGEVRGAIALIDRDAQMTLAELSDALDPYLSPVLSSTGLGPADVLLGDLRAAAESDLPTLRSWAEFVMELGRQHPVPYDLLTEDDPEAVELDGVQLILLLLRLSGGLHAIATVNGGIPPSAGVEQASLLPLDLGALLGQAGGNPCNMFAEPRADAVSLVGSNAAQQLWGWLLSLRGLEVSGETVGRLYAAGNAALAFAKLLIYFAAFQMTVELDGGAPLIRTKDTTAGEKRVLTAKLSYETGDAAYLNCLRFLMNGSGFDLNLPPDGPIADVPVEWSLLEGGGQGGFVEIYAVSSGSNPVRTTTDAGGNTKTGLQGKPQRYKLPQNVPSIDRKAVVFVNPILVPPSMWNDVMSALGTVTSGAAAPAVIVSELAMRGFLGFFSRKYHIPVTDWAADFKIDTRLAWWDYFGVKCDGPGGDWDVSVGGGFESGDVTLATEGNLFVKLDERSLLGTWGMVFRQHLEGLPGATATGEATVGGKARLDPERMELILKITEVSGDFDVNVAGYAGSGAYQKGSEVRLPVEGGVFCQSGQ